MIHFSSNNNFCILPPETGGSSLLIGYADSDNDKIMFWNTFLPGPVEKNIPEQLRKILEDTLIPDTFKNTASLFLSVVPPDAEVTSAYPGAKGIYSCKKTGMAAFPVPGPAGKPRNIAYFNESFCYFMSQAPCYTVLCENGNDEIIFLTNPHNYFSAPDSFADKTAVFVNPSGNGFFRSLFSDPVFFDKVRYTGDTIFSFDTGNAHQAGSQSAVLDFIMFINSHSTKKQRLSLQYGINPSDDTVTVYCTGENTSFDFSAFTTLVLDFGKPGIFSTIPVTIPGTVSPHAINFKPSHEAYSHFNRTAISYLNLTHINLYG